MPTRDRQTGDLIEEPLPHGALLRAAYAPGPWAAGALGPLVSAVVGWWARRSWSRGAIPAFAREQGVDPATLDRPLDAFPSLDAFFARVAPHQARPICTHGVASPCDGRVRAFPSLAVDAPLPVKGQRTSLRELLGDEALADALDGSAALLVRLAPGDLHQVVLPVEGRVGAPRWLGGPLHSVHPVALAAGAPALRNRRVVVPIDGPSGPGALVAIGALNVGSVEVRLRPGDAARGAPAAAFHLGGSAVVWVGQGLRWDPDLLAATAQGLELRVRLGEHLGELHPTPSPAPRVAELPAPPPTQAMPGVSAVLDAANLVTLTGLATAWAALAASLGEHHRIAFCLLLLAGFLDTVDGFVARRVGGTREARQLGVVLDSLVDAVAFGVLPALLLVGAGLDQPLDLAVLGLLPLAVVVRLAAWTVRARVRRPRRFVGVPSTMSALLVPGIALLSVLAPAAFRPAALVLVAGLAAAMLLPVPIPRGGALGKLVLGVLALATAGLWLAWG